MIYFFMIKSHFSIVIAITLLVTQVRNKYSNERKRKLTAHHKRQAVISHN